MNAISQLMHGDRDAVSIKEQSSYISALEALNGCLIIKEKYV
jgi:hypothetical protein